MRASADASEAFGEVRRVGRDLEAGILVLLFETEPLSRLVRDYGII